MDKTPTTPTKFERNGRPTVLLDGHEAAAYLAVSRDTIRRMAIRGELPHTRVGVALRFRVVDLDEYLEKNTSRKWQPIDGRGPGRKRTKGEFPATSESFTAPDSWRTATVHHLLRRHHERANSRGMAGRTQYEVLLERS